MPTTTPDTLNYLFLAVGVTAVLTLGYIASMVIRHRNALKDEQLVHQLAQEE